MATRSSSSRSYLDVQKAFWNRDEATSRLGRVDTISRSCREYEERADRDFEILLSGIEERIDANTTVLEIGCGVGRLLSRLLACSSPKLIIGADISPGMISHARNALGSRENLRLVVNSGEDLAGISDTSVDIVLSNDVFIHIHDIDVVRKYLNEIIRVLKPSRLFRFNVRHLQLAKMFSNSLGGLLSKASYVSGIRSPLKKNGKSYPGI